MTHSRQCEGTKADGSPCESPFVNPKTGYCHAHGPGAKARMAERGAKGAEATKRKLRGMGVVQKAQAPGAPETVEDAKLIASWAVRAVLVGEIDTKVSHQVANLLREFRAASKEADLAAELGELREVVAELKRNRGRR